MKWGLFCGVMLFAACGLLVGKVDGDDEDEPYDEELDLPLGADSESGPTEADPDETGPIIEHEEVTEEQTYGEPVFIDAFVTDAEGEVLVVEVWFKTEDTMVWDNEVLSDDDGEGGWSGEIPGDEVVSGGMDYYLTAMDDSGNETFFPEEGDSLHFRVSP